MAPDRPLSRRTWFRQPLDVLLLSVTLSLLASGVARAERSDWGHVSDAERTLAPPAQWPEANAVVIYDVGLLSVPKPYKGNQVTLECHRRIKIFHKAGSDAAARVKIWLGWGQTLSGLHAHTLSPKGEEIEVERKDIFTRTVRKDDKEVVFTFPGVQDGSILEYRYDIRQDHYGFLPGWNFQSDLYTLESDFTLGLAEGYDYSAIRMNLGPEAREPERIHHNGVDGARLDFHWQLKGLVPVEDEPYMGSANAYRAGLRFQLRSYHDPYGDMTFAEDWAGLGRLAINVIADHARKDDGVKETARLTTAQATTDRERIRALYEFVRDQISTVEEDPDFLPSTSMEQVLARRRGSAADKNALLVELLRSVGLIARPMLIGTRDRIAFNPGVCEFEQFNQLVCLVETGGDAYALDTQERAVAFPYLPPVDLSPGGLLLDPDSSRMILLDPKERPSARVSQAHLQVHKDGSATCRGRIHLAGYFLQTEEALLKDSLSVRDVQRALRIDPAFHCRLTSYHQEAHPDGDSATVSFELELGGMTRGAAGRGAFCPTTLWPAKNPFLRAHRSYPVDFLYSQVVDRALDIDFDPGLTPGAPPRDVQLDLNGISYTRTAQISGRGVHIECRFVIGQPVVRPAQYEDLRTFYQKMADAESEMMSCSQ